MALSIPSAAEKVVSPDGRVSAEISVKDNRLVFSGRCDGREVWLPSAAGLTLDGERIFENVSIRKAGAKRIDEKYLVLSSADSLRNIANELTVDVRNRKTGNSYQMDIRCYDNGIAYRTRIPRNPARNARRINSEEAEWRLPAGGRAVFGERNSSWKLKTYAGEFRISPLDSLHLVSEQGPMQMMPILYETSDSLYLTIAEAALFNYSGMRLKAEAGGLLRGNFTEPDGFDVEGEITTPWRVLMINRNLSEVVNNHLLTDLAPAADPLLFSDRSWIRPGRSVWSWWSNIDGRFMTSEGEKEMIDRASNLGFEYTTLDEGWEDRADKWGFVADLVKYGAPKKVDVILWRHWNRLNNPRDNYAAMGLFMDSVAAAGAKGLKIDYMNGEDKERVDFTTRALQLAAERRLLVNFHGCQKPSGEMRTYPNEITREAVRGLELNRISADYNARMRRECKPVLEGPQPPGTENIPIPAAHDVLLPLTRGALGPTDYTPVGISNPGYTTPAHHLAMSVLLESPLQTMAENPFHLFRNKGLKPAIDFLGSLPTVWDEREVLKATRLGGSLMMKKRSGRDYYLAGVSVKSVPVTLTLDFLDEDGIYEGLLIKDSAEGFTADKKAFRKGDVLEANMSDGGGFLLRLKRVACPRKEIALWDGEHSPRHKVEVKRAEHMDRNGHVWNVSEPTLTIYSPADSERKDVAVVICPGGGYAFGSFLKEGEWFAEWLASHGIVSGVLKYRMPEGVDSVPSEDAARAFDIMREHAAEYGFDAEKIGIMGFSAGGHLAGTMVTHGRGAARPAFGVLMYPVITMDYDLTHKGSRRSLIGESPDASKIAYYSLELQPDKKTPPTLLMASADDRTVKVENTIGFVTAMRRAGADVASYIFPSGGHGWGFKRDFRYHEDMKRLLLDWLESR